MNCLLPSRRPNHQSSGQACATCRTRRPRTPRPWNKDRPTGCRAGRAPRGTASRAASQRGAPRSAAGQSPPSAAPLTLCAFPASRRRARRGPHGAPQVLPDYASKAFFQARNLARDHTHLFGGMSAREMPTVHEIRALSSQPYVAAGYEVSVVQARMAHTDPDMTRAYQKAHARRCRGSRCRSPTGCRSVTMPSTRGTPFIAWLPRRGSGNIF